MKELHISGVKHVKLSVGPNDCHMQPAVITLCIEGFFGRKDLELTLLALKMHVHKWDNSIDGSIRKKYHIKIYLYVSLVCLCSICDVCICVSEGKSIAS